MFRGIRQLKKTEPFRHFLVNRDLERFMRQTFMDCLLLKFGEIFAYGNLGRLKTCLVSMLFIALLLPINVVGQDSKAKELNDKLYFAVKNNNLTTVEKLLKQGADPNANYCYKTDGNNSFGAVIVEILTLGIFDITGPSTVCKSIMQSAAKGGNSKIIEALIKYDGSYRDLYSDLFESGKLRMVEKLLLQNEVSIQEVGMQEYAEYAFKKDANFLIRHPDAYAFLVDTLGYQSNFVQSRAIHFNNYKILKELIKPDTDFNWLIGEIKDDKNYRVLRMLLDDYPDRVKRLQNKELLFRTIVESGDVKFLNIMLQKLDYPINATDENGIIMLMRVGSQHVEVFDYLLENGANVNITDNDGKGVLHHIVDHYYSSRNLKNLMTITQKLVDAGLDINQLDKSGQSVLFSVVKNFSYEDLEIYSNQLKKLGINVTLKDLSGRGPFGYYLDNERQFGEVKTLLRLGLDPYDVARNGDNIFDIAICNHAMVVIDFIADSLEIQPRFSEKNEYCFENNYEVVSHVVEKKWISDPERVRYLTTKCLSKRFFDLPIEQVENLLEIGADPNLIHKIRTYDRYGIKIEDTVYLEKVKLLLKYGAKVNDLSTCTLNDRACLPLDQFSEEFYPNISSYLRDNGAIKFEERDKLQAKSNGKQFIQLLKKNKEDQVEQMIKKDVPMYFSKGAIKHVNDITSDTNIIGIVKRNEWKKMFPKTVDYYYSLGIDFYSRNRALKADQLNRFSTGSVLLNPGGGVGLMVGRKFELGAEFYLSPLAYDRKNSRAFGVASLPVYVGYRIHSGYDFTSIRIGRQYNQLDFYKNDSNIDQAGRRSNTYFLELGTGWKDHRAKYQVNPSWVMFVRVGSGFGTGDFSLNLGLRRMFK